MRVIPHPTQNGYWTIAVDGSIYGCYDRRELAIAVLLKRWVLCERPNIQVGGELTLDMLEVNHSEHNRVWIAPLLRIVATC